MVTHRRTAATSYVASLLRIKKKTEEAVKRKQEELDVNGLTVEGETKGK